MPWYPPKMPVRSRLPLWFGLLMFAALSSPASLAAQVGKHGAITTRSDIKMSIEGAPGTGATRVEGLAKAMGAPLSSLKLCYAKLVEERPELTGLLEVDVLLERGKKKAKVAPAGDSGLDRAMKRCVDRAFQRFDAKDVLRPAKARIKLELTNSAAASVATVRDREQTASGVQVLPDGEGGYFAQGQSTEGQVHYRVEGGQPKEVETTARALRGGLAGLFDCRRRAGKKGSPAGELVADARLRKKGKPDVRITSSSVPTERAPFCVDRALTSVLKGAGPGRVKLTVTFR